MPNRRKGIYVSLSLALSGIIALANAASRPSFDAMRAIDVVRLIAVGMCFGAAIVIFGMSFRGPASN